MTRRNRRGGLSPAVFALYHHDGPPTLAYPPHLVLLYSLRILLYFRD